MHDCICCGEAVYSDDDLCSCCIEANCDDSGDDCQIPTCPACETRSTFCTDRQWHTNCDCKEYPVTSEDGRTIAHITFDCDDDATAHVNRGIENGWYPIGSKVQVTQ